MKQAMLSGPDVEIPLTEAQVRDLLQRDLIWEASDDAGPNERLFRVVVEADEFYEVKLAAILALYPQLRSL